jgi:domain of unknown function (DUF1814)
MNNLDDIYKYLVDTANLISQSRFSDKMILKGGSVLISKIIENSRLDLYRKTTDLDIHCDKREVWINFYTNIESILNSNKLGYVYKIIDRRSQRKGFDKSDSIKFSLSDTNCNKAIEFKIDININSNTIITCDYSPILNMTTYDALTMISDKITVVSSQKIYRRIKDLYDLCVLISLYDFTYYDVIEHIRKKHSGVKLENMLLSNNFSSLEHAFSKYEGISNKPNIMTIISLAQAFLQPIYCSNKVDMLWKKEISAWVSS